MQWTRAIFLLLACGNVMCHSAKSDFAEGGSGIVYGKGHAFALTAPKGWVLDNRSGISQGLHAVFYPTGGSWQTSASVMYAKASSKSHEVSKTLPMLMSFDSSEFVQSVPGVTISNDESLGTGDNNLAVVRRFVYSQFAAIAYIDEEQVIAMLVLTCRTEADFKTAYPAFKGLVKSYIFMTSNVRIDGR